MQVAGFERSAFGREKWRRTSAGAAYRPGLDLVVRDADGDAAAASGTAWLWSAGGSAILEPVATHRDHRRGGHGKRIVQALATACQEQGAAGVTVWTPCANEAAVATYRKAGFALVAVWLNRRDS